MKLKFGVVVAMDAKSVTSPVTPAGVPAGRVSVVVPSGTTPVADRRIVDDGVGSRRTGRDVWRSRLRGRR